MQKVINLTNKYIILATPLILYSLISTVYMAVSLGSGKIVNLIFAICLFILMTAAFIAGWFNMIKSAIVDDRDNPNSLINVFVSGVGEYFVPSIGAFLLMLTISVLLIIASYFMGMNIIGDPGITVESLTKAMQNPAALKIFVAGLSMEQLIKLNLWNVLIFAFMTITYFILFLYMPALFYKNKNPFIAYYLSLKDLFSRKIFKTTGIFIAIFFANFVLSILSAILGGNVIMHFVLTLLNFYFVTFVCVGVFYYYYHNFVKTMIGQNVDVEI